MIYSVLRRGWLTLIVLAGCFSPHFDDNKISCGPGDECPPGLTCVQGVCRTPGTTGDTTAPPTPILTSVTPMSPANNNMPIVVGSAEADSTVKLYTDSGCTALISTGTAAQLGNPGITVNVTDDSTTQFYATAADMFGNTSPCSLPISYVEDSTAPPTPTLTDTQPPSPSRSLTPKVRGTAEPNTKIVIFPTSGCTGTALGMGTADATGAFAVDVTVTPASTTDLYAVAKDAAGNTSACSGSAITYIHNANALSAPTITSSTPPSPSKTSTNPTLSGTAEASVMVRLYTDGLCSSTLAGSATSDAQGAWSAAVSVAQNSTTTFYAQAFDSAVGQYSACSSSSLTFVHDSIAPNPPVVSGSSPASPSNSMAPTITGTAEAGSTVALYTDAACTVAVMNGSGPATNGAFAIQVAASGSTTYYATATDAAGNTSGCSTAGYNFVYDATAPAAPTLTGTSPASPSQTNNTPIVIGTAESGSTVHVYRTSDCTGAEAGSGLATPGFGISITVPSNSTTALTATAVDVAGNVSPCSAMLTYVHDSLAPAAPMLTGTNPVSPANMNMPQVLGMTEAGAVVQLYTDASCTTPIGSPATAGSGGAFAITISVTDNTATTVYAKASDGAGNASPCSAGLGYTEDSAGPATPTLNSLPPSNSNTMPTLTGTAEASTTVYIYASSSCGGSPVAMGTTTGAGTYSIGVTVTANTSTAFTAKAVDAASNASACSASITYVHDNMAPARPTGLASNPVSPAGSTSPAITGMAEANATVYLYTNPTCSSSVAGTATASAGGAFSIPVTVAAGSTNTFYATATDSANNTSLCSTASVTYIQDNIPPGPPTNLSSTPGSPANNGSPSITGNAEASSVVKLYTAAGCGAASFKAMGTTNGTGMFSIPTTVTANTTTTFYATATDGAGNVSTCTTSGYAYVMDSTPPATPSGLTTTPPSPANFNTPSIKGTTEAAAAVAVYKDAGCTMSAGTGTAAADGSFNITVTVADNTTTTFYVRATDAAMNSSTCNAAGSSITYVEDSTAVQSPTLASTTPASPSNASTTPTVNGTSGANFTIKIYTDASCAGALLATGTASAGGAFAIPVTVTANTTTTFYATAFNGANTSACSSGLVYIHDSIAPAAPTNLSVVPTGPANDNTPTLRGGAEASSTVRLYTDASCTSAVAGTGTAAADGTFAVMVASGIIADNTTTTLYAKATDGAGNGSTCSAAGVTYVEDSAAPNAPTISSTSPPSPANFNNPTVNGTAEVGATVALYTAAGCSGASIGSTTADSGGAWSIAITVPDNTTTPLFAKAIDAASNASGCTSSAFNYVEDSAPPGAPSLTMVVPAGPANQNNPVVSGTTTEAGATIRLFADPQCSGTVIGTATSTNGGAFSVTATVLDDTTTVFYANARDAAGNTSACSSNSLSYTEDSTPPDAPQGLVTDPKSPANDNQPTVYGSGEAGTTVHIYADDKCLTSPVGVGTVDASGKFMAMVNAGAIADNTTVSLSASLTDAAGNVSTCGSAISYQEDSIANPPNLLSTTPSSPSSSSTTPTINGTAEIGATIQLFTNNTCSGALVGSGTAGSTGAFSISVSSVMPNTSTTYWGNIIDQAGNASTCSTTNVTFISDQAPPTFAGVSSAVATAFDKIFVTWPSATDNFTTPANMRYEICWGITPRACDSWVTKLTVTGTSRTVTGLSASTRYYFQVRAIDQAGNIGVPSPTQVEATDRTWGAGATTMIATGYNFACALQGDGTVQCWGAGGNGQLGNGASSDSLTPVTVTGLVDAIAVSAGGAQAIGTAHACALKADGTVWCWGYGGNGNLGNGNTISYNTPQQVVTSLSPLIALTNVTAISAGGGHTCALKSDGTIHCWGRNSDGQLGDGTSTQKNVATLVSGGITTFATLDAGAYHTCATLTDGTARCWGQNTFGQLGNGNNTGQLAPVGVLLSAADRAKAIDVGDYHSCALIYNGTVRCWGANTTGQLGNNTTTNANSPVTVLTTGALTMTNVSAIAAGGAFVGGAVEGTSCAVLANGTMRCWGYNGSGQLGNGNTTNQVIAVVVSGVSSAVRASIGADFTCGLSVGGQVACAGQGANGRLGTGNTTSQSTPQVVQNLYGVEGATSVSATYNSQCARFSNGRVRCWGYNGFGQLGNNTTTNTAYPEIPVLQGGNPVTNFASVSTTYYTACGLRGDGTVACWGYNAFGQLGDGTTTNNSQAVTVSGVTNAIAVTTGFYHGCALISDGSVKCWGYNGYGQLGNNTTTDSSTAVMTMSLSNATAVTGAGYTTCAALADGTAKCWGWNAYGQIGDMTTVDKHVPTVVTGIANARELGGGGYHVCALIGGGTAKCWGQGDKGQMGTGLTNTTNSTPVMVSGSGFVHIGSGFYDNCTTKADGRAYCWGYNAAGQIGNGTVNTPVTTQTMVSGLATVTRVSTGYHSSALHADGTVEAWGQADSGQCGDGDLTTHNNLTAQPVLYVP